jgi:hypothetical protein
LAQRGIDWEAFLRSALRHGVLPLVYRSLRMTCPDAVPPVVLEQYKMHYRAAAWRSLFLTEALVRILRLFERAGLLAIPFKGPALATSLYGDPTLRSFDDLDIVVPQKDIWAARNLLIEEGYHPELNLTDGQVEDWFESSKEHHFVLGDKESRVIVELHWRLTQDCYAFPLDSQRLWHRLVRVRLADMTVPGFPAEELLLILCMHGAKHGWHQLKLVCDVAELVRAHPELDWGQLGGRARKLGCERMLGLGLVLAHDLLGTVVPEGSVAGLRVHAIQTLFRKVYERFLHQDPGGSDPEDKWAFYLAVRERLADRVRVCRGLGEIPPGTDWVVFPLHARLYHYLAMGLLPNERDRDVVDLPAPLHLLYLVIRPLRLMRKYTWHLGKQLLASIRGHP